MFVFTGCKKQIYLHEKSVFYLLYQKFLLKIAWTHYFYNNQDNLLSFSWKCREMNKTNDNPPPYVKCLFRGGSIYVVREGVCRRVVWGPLLGPQRVEGRALVGAQGGAGKARKAPRKLWGFEELQTFIWTTILNQPRHFYQTKKTWLWVLILSDNC